MGISRQLQQRSEGTRCGIHGDSTETGRCATCDRESVEQVNAPHGYGYGYLDRSGRVRCLTMSASDARLNAKLNNGRVVRVALTASGTVACTGPVEYEEVDA